MEELGEWLSLLLFARLADRFFVAKCLSFLDFRATNVSPLSTTVYQWLYGRARLTTEGQQWLYASTDDYQWLYGQARLTTEG